VTLTAQEESAAFGIIKNVILFGTAARIVSFVFALGQRR